MALGLGLMLSQTPLNGDDVYDGDNWLEIGLSIFIMSHLFIVIFRSHGILAYCRLARAGHRISYQKVLLLFLTGVCSNYAWGFNPFGMAFFVMNVFHAWQYFALIWWSERKTLTRLVGREGCARAGAAALTLLLGTGLAYGLVAGLYSGGNSWIVSAFLVVS